MLGRPVAFPAMRSRVTAAAGLVAAAAAAVAFATPAAAGPVGGSLLSGTGLVEQPLAGAPALPTDIAASSWLVADATTGAVLAAKAPHERFLPASTLKTLTALTLIPKLDPQQLVKVNYNDAVVDGSKVGLVPGMRYTVDKLFTCMLVVSANDAAEALASAAGGDRATVREMNEVARRLHADDTHAGTPSGLDAPGEHSSAYDLALISRAAMKQPAFMRYVQTVKSTVPAPHHKHYQIYTHNRLLTGYRGDLGGKNGYTVAAEGTYVGFAHRGGHTIIVTLMHANPDFWGFAQQLLSWGFKAEGTVVPVGQLVEPAAPPSRANATQPHAIAAPAQLRRSAVALVSRHGRGVPVWQLAALAVSAAGVALVTTLRQQRRRGRSRLSLPPL
jgi:D-alanyl-D-alanine carboxypeptidase (penicillin-binding protein 5/6)